MQHTQKGEAEKKGKGGEKPTDVKIGKRSFQQWSWVILAPSPPRFLLEVSHRPGPNSEHLEAVVVGLKRIGLGGWK